jgi:thioredoxin:protein disulfide reductase
MHLRRDVIIGLLGLALVLGSAAIPSAAGAPGDVVLLGGRVRPERSGARVTVRVEIAPGYHINSNKPDEPYLVPTTLELSAGDTPIGAPTFPPAKSERFKFSPKKALSVYSGTIEIEALADAVPESPVKAQLRYQACDDTRCLPPRTVSAMIGVDQPAAARSGSPLDGESSRLLAWLQGASLPTALGITLLLGLTLNLTPCVYPLISVTLGYFGSQQTGARAPWSLAAVYVLGITISFAALGVSAALAGGLFGAPLQHPAVLIGLAGVLIALALSSFGLYEIRAPHALVNRFGVASAGMGGAFLMGLTMGVIAAPCIGPVVLGLLLYVGSERSVVKGFLLFFSMGLGMGLPYVALGSAAGSLAMLPRAGEWLRWMNRFFGVLLLGMALYFLSPLLDGDLLRILVPVYIGLAGFYLGFLEPSARSSRAFTLGRRSVGVAAVLVAMWLAIPGGASTDGIRWEPLSPDALDRAIAARRPALVEFGADWCLPCVEMEHSTFVDPGVTRAVRAFSALQADVTETTPANDALLAQFQIVGVPTIIVYDARGREVERVVGFVDAERLLAMLRRAVDGGGEGGKDREAPTQSASVAGSRAESSRGVPDDRREDYPDSGNSVGT